MRAPPDAADYFGERSLHYDSRYDRLDADGYALRSRMERVVALLGPGPGTVLDAGMGPGRLCVELSRLGWTVSGIDASEEMVAAARDRLPEAASRLRRAEIEALPWEDASFDAVTATGVLEYSDVPQALRELARVLRPGGRAIISYPNPGAVYGIWKSRVWYPTVRGVKRALRRPDADMPHSAGRLPPGRFVEALTDAGLEHVAMAYTSFIPLITPIERLLPRTSSWLGDQLEIRVPRTGGILATQIVYDARLAHRPPHGKEPEH